MFMAPSKITNPRVALEALVRLHLDAAVLADVEVPRSAEPLQQRVNHKPWLRNGQVSDLRHRSIDPIGRSRCFSSPSQPQTSRNSLALQTSRALRVSAKPEIRSGTPTTSFRPIFFSPRCHFSTHTVHLHQFLARQSPHSPHNAIFP